MGYFFFQETQSTFVYHLVRFRCHTDQKKKKCPNSVGLKETQLRGSEKAAWTNMSIYFRWITYIKTLRSQFKREWTSDYEQQAPITRLCGRILPWKKSWLALDVDSERAWGSSPLQHYQTTHMCGDKWVNIFCQILHPKPRGSCLLWKPAVWLSRVGLMSRRNGREQTCVWVCTVCLCTLLWHNGGQASQYKWLQRCLAQSWQGTGLMDV